MSSRLSWHDRLTRHYYLVQLLLQLRAHGVARDLWAASIGCDTRELDAALQLLRPAPGSVLLLGQFAHIPAPQLSRLDLLRFRLACYRHWLLQLADLRPRMPL